MSWVRSVRILQAGGSGLLADAAQKLTERSWEEVPRSEKLKNMFHYKIDPIPKFANKPGLLRKGDNSDSLLMFFFNVTALFAQGESLASDNCVLTILRDVILFRVLEGVLLFYQLCEVLENFFHLTNVGYMRSFPPLQLCL